MAEMMPLPPLRFRFSKQAMEKIACLGDEKQFERNAILAKPGEQPSYCYVVLDGSVIGYEYTVSGEERIYNVMETGAILLETNLLLDEPCNVYFRTFESCRLSCLTKEKLLHAIAQDPNTAKAVIDYISRKFLSAMEQLRNAYGHTSTWNVCNFLLEYAYLHGEKTNGMVCLKNHFQQQTIASLMGFNRVTVARIFQQLREQGLVIRQENRWYITDMTALTTFRDQN